ncbi:cytochrome P450 750A1-like [Cryptomeria japonica]|uniref:cytochrome P450 750A1-like n=1 Tax=Cryptomeria japonica TaxID=3369 RepID=UPI0025AC1FE7|nr:cytochrome P450 750A1-like [Cryptomeria japonica]
MAVTILVMLLIFYIFSRQRRRLPPGPFPWPIVGNLLQMGELVHRSLHDISKKYGPIASLKLSSVTAIVISSPEMAKEMKKLCMVELLNAKRIESMRSMREEEVSLAVRSVWEKSRHGKVAVNLSQIISSLVQSQILRILCGTKSDDQRLH